jgi:C4-type Zn-finger protein
VRLRGEGEIVNCPKCNKKMEFRHYTTPLCGQKIITKLYACVDCRFAKIVEEERDEGRGRQTNL